MLKIKYCIFMLLLASGVAQGASGTINLERGVAAKNYNIEVTVVTLGQVFVSSPCCSVRYEPISESKQSYIMLAGSNSVSYVKTLSSIDSFRYSIKFNCLNCGSEVIPNQYVYINGTKVFKHTVVPVPLNFELKFLPEVKRSAVNPAVLDLLLSE